MTGSLESEPAKIEKGTLEIDRTPELADGLGRQELVREASGGDSKLPFVSPGQKIENLPEIKTAATEADLDELKKPSAYEYVEPPHEIEMKGGETLDSVAEANLKAFLGDDYESLTEDPLNKRNFLKSYKKALAYINGADENSITMVFFLQKTKPASLPRPTKTVKFPRLILTVELS